MFKLGTTWSHEYEAIILSYFETDLVDWNAINLWVNTGFSDSLQIYYNPPMSNGGNEILRYRVELDPMSSFNNPIIETKGLYGK